MVLGASVSGPTDARNGGVPVRPRLEAVLETGRWRDEGLRSLLWDYYAAVETVPFRDLSVLVERDGRIAAAALANDAGGMLGYFGQPAVLSSSPDLAPTERDATLEKLLQRLDATRRRAGLAAMHLTCASSPDCPPAWARTLQEEGAAVVPLGLGEIDLSQSEEELWRGLRKSYRQLVKWGRRSLDMRFVDASDPDRAAFDTYQSFHHRIAGRATRPQASWDCMYRYIVEGKAELLLGYLDGEQVSATFVFFDRDSAVYGSGVYERSRFDKPLAHWPVYCSILRAKQRGNTMFSLGEVALPQEASKKERDIAFFKKGFTGTVEWSTQWRIVADGGGDARTRNQPREGKPE